MENILNKIELARTLIESTSFDINSLNSYIITEDVIDYLVKSNIIGIYLYNNTVKEETIELLLKEELIEPIELKEFSMGTYSNLTDEFIQRNIENIDIEKYILYKVATLEHTKDIEKYTEIIEKYNLFDIVSGIDLDIEFIRKYKDNLNWNTLKMVKEFNYLETIEFSEYLDKVEYNIIDLIKHSASSTEHDNSEMGFINLRENIANIKPLENFVDKFKFLNEGLITSLNQNGYKVNTSSNIHYNCNIDIVIDILCTVTPNENELEIFTEVLKEIRSEYDVKHDVKYSVKKGHLNIIICNKHIENV